MYVPPPLNTHATHTYRLHIVASDLQNKVVIFHYSEWLRIVRTKAGNVFMTRHEMTTNSNGVRPDQWQLTTTSRRVNTAFI